MFHDHVNLETAERAISPLTQTNADTAIVSQIIDTSCKDSITFILATGILSDTNATFATKLEESADSGMSGATDITSDATKVIGTVPQFDFSNDNTVYSFGYKGALRYLRVTVTPSGNNSGDCPISCVCVSRNKKIGTGPTGS